MKTKENNFLIGASVIGGITLLGIVIWQFSKSKKTTLELTKNKDTKPTTPNSPNVQNNNSNVPINNQMNEVMKLQSNVNKLYGENMLIDGIYGPQTNLFTESYFRSYWQIGDISNFSIEKMVDMTNSHLKNGIDDISGYYDRKGVWNTIARDVIEYNPSR